jgi:hypothetical protein
MAEQILVIGGGAAGFMGAIMAAIANPQAQVTIVEAGRDPLAKVKISGGGRCNVTHACFEPARLVQHYPRGGKALRGAFSRFQPRDTIAWFRERQVMLKTEADGRMFPKTDDSETIVDCLMFSARSAGVKLITGAAAKSIEKSGDRFIVQMRSGNPWLVDKILLATGSSPQGHAIARSLGHTIAPTAPSLFTFNIKDSRIQDLAGISVDPVQVKLQVGDERLEQTGPLLITHWGVSGPAVLKLSAWGARLLQANHYQAQLTINWLPQENPETLRQALNQTKTDWSKRTIVAHSPFSLPRRLWESLTVAAGIQPQTRWAELAKTSANRLAQELRQGKYEVTGKGVFKEEFVTCGGVNLKEVEFKTMESKVCPGLYFAGEILDVDGITGGFNFQNAWTTGWLAGQAIGQAIQQANN